MASVLTSLAVQIRNVSNLYQVYQLSGSAFMLGLTGFLETLPFIVFGLFAGAVADAFDRKKVLLVTMVVQLVPSASMIVLTHTGAIQVWHIYTLGFVGAFVDVFNWPARSALIPRLVPPGAYDERRDDQLHDTADQLSCGTRRGRRDDRSHRVDGNVLRQHAVVGCPPSSPYPRSEPRANLKGQSAR